jgi:hypothetical protein
MCGGPRSARAAWLNAPLTVSKATIAEKGRFARKMCAKMWSGVRLKSRRAASALLRTASLRRVTLRARFELAQQQAIQGLVEVEDHYLPAAVIDGTARTPLWRMLAESIGSLVFEPLGHESLKTGNPHDAATCAKARRS